MTINHLAVAVSSGNARTLLVQRYPYSFEDSETVGDFIAIDPDTGAIPLYLTQQGRLFQYDANDTTTADDGITCLVTSDNLRYKVNDFDTPYTVLDKGLTAPPDSPTIGDAHIVGVAATGAWSGHDNAVAFYSRRGWIFATAPVGKQFLNQDDGALWYRNGSGSWQTGSTLAFSSKSIPLSSLMWAGASSMLRVQNQTTYAPPGSRKTGGTPTAPLGGTAANFNDNDDTTTCVTSALNDLSGASVASRIIAKLALAAATDLICIEVRGVLGSAASSASAMGLYYSTDNGATWTLAGSGFTLSTSAQNVQRTGTFAGVTHFALVTEAKNWSTNTNTLAGLNAYDATVTASVGDAYIIGPNPFGVFAGDSNKVAICEAANAFTIYAPQAGDKVYDVAQASDYRFDGTSWNKSSGEFKIKFTAFTSTGNFTHDPNCFGVKVYLIGGGGQGYAGGGPGTSGGPTTFGAHLKAEGGLGGDVSSGGAPGTLTAGMQDFGSSAGSSVGGVSGGPFGSAASPRNLGKGGDPTSGGGDGAGAGASGVGWVDASDLSDTELVTIGGRGGNGTSGGCFIEEYIRI